MGAVALWHVTYDNLVIFFQVQVKLILVIHNPSDPLEGLTNKLVHDLLYNDFVSSAGVAKSHANAKTKTYFRSPHPLNPFSASNCQVPLVLWGGELSPPPLAPFTFVQKIAEKTSFYNSGCGLKYSV